MAEALTASQRFDALMEHALIDDHGPIIPTLEEEGTSLRYDRISLTAQVGDAMIRVTNGAAVFGPERPEVLGALDALEEVAAAI
jgi:hypothetical protein